MTVDSAYFFGEPVANADVQVYLFSRDSYWDEWTTYEQPIFGRTDEDGRFTLSINPREGSAAIEATVAAGTITLTIQAENEGVVLDAIELPLEIQPLAVPDVTTAFGQLEDNFTTEIDWPDAALPAGTLKRKPGYHVIAGLGR